MPKAAIVLLADAATPEGTGRMVNALTTTKEFKDAGDDAILIFDGAGTRWRPRLTDPDEKYHRLLAMAPAFAPTAVAVGLGLHMILSAPRRLQRPTGPRVAGPGDRVLT